MCYPRWLRVAEVPLDTVPRVRTNGVSIRGLLQDIPASIPERTIYWEFGKQAGDPNSGIVGEVFQAARRGQWKAVRYGLDAPVELYDITADRGEQCDLSEEHPTVHDEFVELFEEYRE